MRPVYRFDLLDGYRGIAALAVLLMHMLRAAGLEGAVQGAYLAVDLFFLMSGFVIARAYEQKLLGGMTVRQFMRIRLERLYPLIVLGALLGGAVGALNHDLLTTLTLTARAMFLVPTALHGQALPDWLITFNFAGWSLLWELVVNLCYALLIRVMTGRILALLIAISACMMAWQFQAYGWMNFGSTGGNGFAGLVRAEFGFFLGVALFRIRESGRLLRLRVPTGPAVAALAAVLALSWPFPGLRWVDLVAVWVLFPLLVISGINADVPARWASVCRWLGAMSYPVYILQSAPSEFLRLLGHGYITGPPMAVAIAASMAMLTLLIAYAALKLVDEPIQHRLRTRREVAASAFAYAVPLSASN